MVRHIKEGRKGKNVPVWDRALKCPTCGTWIDPVERCPATIGMGRCMELVGHDGCHWTDFGGGGVRVWTGEFSIKACAGRLSLHWKDWCKKPPGHEGSHSNGHGMMFGDPEECEPEVEL